MSQTEVIFDGKELSVTAAHFGGERVFVTFTSWGKHTSGFGENLFLQRRESAIHFISKRDHWWQPDEVRKALALIVARLLPRYLRIITYGASMGGYGAALYAADLKADQAILIAPQYSIDGDKVPFEKRWRLEAKQIEFKYDDLNDCLSATANKFVLYDPLSVDKQHAALFEGHSNTQLIPIPFGGHVPGKMLLEMGLLKNTLFQIADGNFDGQALRKAIRERRRTSPIYWSTVWEHAINRRPVLAMRAIEYANALAPDDAVNLLRACDLLLRMRRFEEAYKNAKTACSVEPNHPAPWRALSKISLRLGKFSDAISFARKAVSLRERDADLMRTLFEALCAAGQDMEAIEVGRKAVQLAPEYLPPYLAVLKLMLKVRDELHQNTLALQAQALRKFPDSKDLAAFVSLE